MRLRLRFRSVWRGREALVVELRQRCGGRVRDRYVGQATISRAGRIPLGTMSQLARTVNHGLLRAGYDRGTIASLLHGLSGHLLAQGWYREHRHGIPVVDSIVTYARLVFAQFETNGGAE